MTDEIQFQSWLMLITNSFFISSLWPPGKIKWSAVKCSLTGNWNKLCFDSLHPMGTSVTDDGGSQVSKTQMNYPSGHVLSCLIIRTVCNMWNRITVCQKKDSFPFWSWTSAPELQPLTQTDTVTPSQPPWINLDIYEHWKQRQVTVLSDYIVQCRKTDKSILTLKSE